MARPKKKPEYDSDQMAQQIMEAVTDAYLNPPQGTEDDTGHMQLKQLAEEFSMTPLKVRKLLITTGAYCINRREFAICTEKTCHSIGDFPPPRRPPSTKKLCRQSHRQSSEILIFYFGYWNIVLL